MVRRVVQGLRQVRHAVADRQRCEVERREHPDCLAVLGEVAAAGVAGDAGADRVHLVAEALAVGRHDRAGLRAQRLDAVPGRRVAVPEHRGAGAERALVQAGRTAEERHARVEVRGVARAQLDQGEVVVRAQVRVGLAVGLHRDPRAVGHRALAVAPVGALDRHVGAQRARGRGAAVGLGGLARPRAVRRLAEEDPAAHGEHEVGGAGTAAGGVGDDARVQGGAAGGGPSRDDGRAGLDPGRCGCGERGRRRERPEPHHDGGGGRRDRAADADDHVLLLPGCPNPFRSTTLVHRRYARPARSGTAAGAGR